MFKVMDLRKSFLDFFKGRGHRIVPSSSLVPKDDPTLLFTTAGMVQFKPMFAGTVELEYTRAATVQKCLRTSDLENVGKTKRHLTFFEMLGNFSFGDYFKKEAIEYAWDYSTSVIGFPKDSIWISIFQDDDEAFEIWHKGIGIPQKKIIRLGREDNFWGPAGDTGACGPCSELYIDRGPDFGCGSKDCRPGCDCERFLEYWNLVFNQYNQNSEGVLEPLPRTGIDTGMGLERLAALVQDVDSVYDTDEFASIARFVSTAGGVSYEGENIVPINIIAEHARALTFAMSDGIYPSNDGRGYVLRRILRRALRFSRQMGVTEPFVYRVVDPIVEIMGDFYPEIKDPAAHVKNVIESEEKRFLETLENGMDRLDEIMKAAKKRKAANISGEDAFVLYDTFGFPLEMTVEIAGENGLDVDRDGYAAEMEKQRERGKKSWKASEGDFTDAFDVIASRALDTEFTGYDEVSSDSVVELLHNGNAIADRMGEGDTGIIVLKNTPFYGESGGQVGDIGTIISGSGAQFSVEDTKKYNRTVMHIGRVVKGSVNSGDRVEAAIDQVNRNLIRANHTVTHLLHASLRKVLGTHVKQAGSLVSPERMRFDFSHFSALSREEMASIEDMVNEKIWENIQVRTDVMKMEDAVKTGAMAVFDEKYEDIVRVVTVDDFSRELCGGTHVSSTGEIGIFKILREGSPGAGMRRIEAVTLRGILERYNRQESIINEVSRSLNVAEDGIVKKLGDVMERLTKMEKEFSRLSRETLASDVGAIINRAVEHNGIKIISHLFNDADARVLREISDTIRAREQNSVICFGSDNNGNALLLFAATGNAVKKGIDCGKIVKEVSQHVGGGGGGRKDMAQAGGKIPAGLQKALDEAVSAARAMLSQ